MFLFGSWWRFTKKYKTNIYTDFLLIQNCINLLFRQAIIQLFIDGFDVFITTRGVIALNKNE